MRMRVVAAERQMPISVGVEGDEFDRVEIFGTAPRVAGAVTQPCQRQDGPANKFLEGVNH